jgi:uncharacterized protein involved in exopolysaccharide biosynthesis
MLLGGGGATSNLEKDVTLLKTYRTNEKVLNNYNGYMIRYFTMDKKYKEIEVDNNLSIEVTDVQINSFKHYGMRLIIQPLNNTEYTLLSPSRFSNDSIGIYHYSEIVTHQNFSLMVHKKRDFNSPYTIQLSGTNRYVYENIINQNLNIEIDKNSPFLTLTFIDNLPQRGEAYLKNLIKIYTQQSIDDIKDDVSIIINSYNIQLKKIEQQVKLSSKKLEDFKINNNIIAPELQASALVQELSKVGIDIAQNSYKQELLSNLIKFAQKHENIDAIAPSLIELKDEPTISLIKLIQDQQITLSNLLIKYKIDHPTILRTNQTIQSLRNKVLSNLKNLKKTLGSKNISLQNIEKKYTKKLKSSPKQEQKLITFSRDYKVNEKMYLYLMQERSLAQLKHDKALSRFKVIESIYTSKNPVKPKKALLVMVAFIASITLMILISFFRKASKKNRAKG